MPIVKSTSPIFKTEVPLDNVSRQHGFSKSAFYRWKAQYGGLETGDLKRLKELEAENQRLKRMHAELSLVHQALKDIMQKKLWRLASVVRW